MQFYFIYLILSIAIMVGPFHCMSAHKYNQIVGDHMDRKCQ